MHGYWISPGASLISEKQADAAARIFLKEDIDLIVCPSGEGEWGQGSIGRFIKNKITEKYPQIPREKVISLEEKDAVNTKKELIAGFQYLKSAGINNIIDLAVPFHLPRVRILAKVLGFYGIEYRSLLDYLSERESKELLASKVYKGGLKGEKLRLLMFKNSFTRFLADLVPDKLKAFLEAYLAFRYKN